MKKPLKRFLSTITISILLCLTLSQTGYAKTATNKWHTVYTKTEAVNIRNERPVDLSVGYFEDKSKNLFTCSSRFQSKYELDYGDPIIFNNRTYWLHTNCSEKEYFADGFENIGVSNLKEGKKWNQTLWIPKKVYPMF